MATNTDRAMLPLQSLLNPTASEDSPTASQKYNTFPSPPRHPGPDSFAATPVTSRLASNRASKKADESIILAKSKPRGSINFPPFEDVDEAAQRQILGFGVSPFGKIHQEFHHIPYSSSKKDLFEKTGRESIEAFRYEFRVAGRDVPFVVMWDYNIGIVRMNPFIKWGQFPKTRSSQLLDKNPGLREMSPGITGGAVLAQGYWIPYRCARALFATFCYPIAGALIPLFGPTFPTDCIPPESSNYGNAAISSGLIQEVALQVEQSKRYYMEQAASCRNGVSFHSLLDQRFHRGEERPYPQYRPPGTASQATYGPGLTLHPSSSNIRLPILPQQSHALPLKPPDFVFHAAGGEIATSNALPFLNQRRPEPYHTNMARSQANTNYGPHIGFPHAWEYKRRRVSQDCRVIVRSHQRLGRGEDVDIEPGGMDEAGIQAQSPVASSRKRSSQYTAAMALVLLSGDQREADPSLPSTTLQEGFT